MDFLIYSPTAVKILFTAPHLSPLPDYSRSFNYPTRNVYSSRYPTIISYFVACTVITIIFRH